MLENGTVPAANLDALDKACQQYLDEYSVRKTGVDAVYKNLLSIAKTGNPIAAPTPASTVTTASAPVTVDKAKDAFLSKIADLKENFNNRDTSMRNRVIRTAGSPSSLGGQSIDDAITALTTTVTNEFENLKDNEKIARYAALNQQIDQYLGESLMKTPRRRALDTLGSIADGTNAAKTFAYASIDPATPDGIARIIEDANRYIDALGMTDPYKIDKMKHFVADHAQYQVSTHWQQIFEVLTDPATKALPAYKIIDQFMAAAITGDKNTPIVYASRPTAEFVKPALDTAIESFRKTFLDKFKQVYPQDGENVLVPGSDSKAEHPTFFPAYLKVLTLLQTACVDDLYHDNKDQLIKNIQMINEYADVLEKSDNPHIIDKIKEIEEKLKAQAIKFEHRFDSGGPALKP